MERTTVIVPALLSGMFFLWHNSVSFWNMLNFFQSNNFDDGSNLVKLACDQQTFSNKKKKILCSLLMYPFQLAGSVLLMWDVNHGTYKLTLLYLVLAMSISAVRITRHLIHFGLSGILVCLHDSSVYGLTFGTVALGCNLMMSYYQVPADTLCTLTSLVIYNWHFYWISVIQGFSYLDYVVPMLPLFLETSGFLSNYDAQLAFIYNLFLVCANTENSHGSLMVHIRHVKLARVLSDRNNCVRVVFDQSKMPFVTQVDDEMHVLPVDEPFDLDWYEQYINRVPTKHYTLLEIMSYLCTADHVSLTRLSQTRIGRDEMTEFYYKHDLEIYTSESQKMVSYSYFFSEFFGVSIKWTNSKYTILDEVSKHKSNAIQACIAYIDRKHRGKPTMDGGRFKCLKQKVYTKFLEHEELMKNRNDYVADRVVIPSVRPYRHNFYEEKVVSNCWIIPAKGDEVISAPIDLSILQKLRPITNTQEKEISKIVASNRTQFNYRIKCRKHKVSKKKKVDLNAYKTYVLKTLSNKCKVLRFKGVPRNNCADEIGHKIAFNLALRDKKTKSHKSITKVVKKQWELINNYNPTKIWEGSTLMLTCLTMMKLWDLKWLLNGSMYLYGIDTSCGDLCHLIQNKRPIRNHLNKGRRLFHVFKEIF